MLDERMDHVDQDSAAVSAVRGGEVERYRELVERRNYREPDGFRARLHRDFFRSFAWGYVNRVKDLDRWQFRPQRRGVAKGQVSWNDVEAWVWQQRLERILREGKENPQAPVRSLLQE
jgi:hypothetical protein